MLEYILTVARTEFQAAQNFDQIRMQTVNTNLEGSLFTVFANPLIHFFAGFLHHFFNPRRMNTSIGHQLLKRCTGHFAANRIKA
ncbi:hypothetical protein D3C73_1272970 [compost metagenome]